MTIFLKLSIIVFFISSPFALGGALVSLNWIDNEILFKVVCAFFTIWGLALAGIVVSLMIQLIQFVWNL